MVELFLWRRDQLLMCTASQSASRSQTNVGGVYGRAQIKWALSCLVLSMPVTLRELLGPGSFDPQAPQKRG